MANDNNNINELVSYPDDDPTAEFEIPVLYADQSQRAEDDIASDEDTAEHSVAILQSNLISSTEHIEKLQHELEAARIYTQELEELFNVEDQAKLQDDEARQQLTIQLQEADKQIESYRLQIDALREELQGAQLAEARAVDEIAGFRGTAKDDRCRIYELEKREKSLERKLNSIQESLEQSQAELRAKNDEHDRAIDNIAGLQSELAGARAEIEVMREEVAQSFKEAKISQTELEESSANLATTLGENEQLCAQLDARQAQLDDERRTSELLNGQLTASSEECTRLEADNRQLRQALHSDADSEIDRNRKTIARQTGQLGGYAQEVRQLMTRIRSAEEYADDLRQKLQVKTEITERAVNTRQRLQAELCTAQAKIEGQTTELRETRQQTGDLAEQISKLEAKFEEESRRLRIELDAAQQTIAGQNSVNEQLLSDLYDNKGFRQALELQLSESEDKFDKRVRHLEQKANRLRNQANEYDRKLKNKDEAIAALMHELANRSSTVENIDDIEEVFQEIDATDASQSEEPKNFDRDRVTRLLVGKTEGQELRFPLFKDRLTIGRTAHNDIQLNAQFISRRHAVIVTETGGTKIVDWGSKNGVFVNENRIAEQILRNGDIVTIGTTEFRYQERPKR